MWANEYADMRRAENRCDDDRTVYVGNLGSLVKEEILFELFLQAGPLKRVTISRDKEGRQKSYGFVCYKHREAVPYAIALLNGTWLYGRPIKLQYRYGSHGGGERGPPAADGGSCSSSQPRHSAVAPFPESSVLQFPGLPSHSPSQEWFWNMVCGQGSHYSLATPPPHHHALPSVLRDFLPPLPWSALEFPQWTPPLFTSGRALPSLLAGFAPEAEGQPGRRGSSEKGKKRKHRRLHESQRKRAHRL